MKPNQVDSSESGTPTIRNIPKPLKIFLKILLIVFIGLTFLLLSFKVGNFVYCQTVAICDYFPTMSPEWVASQYEYANQDINLGRYEAARQRLEFILSKDPEYPGAREKLLEVKDILKTTPTP